MTERVLLAWSGGKDSSLALHEVQRTGAFDVKALLTTVTEDTDRVSMHAVRRQLVEKQASSLGYLLEVVRVPDSGSNELYRSRMKRVLERWSSQGVTGVLFGDVSLEDVRSYREQNLERAAMKGFFPLWNRDTGELARSFIDLGFEAIVTCVDGEALSGDFVGRDYDRQFLEELPETVDPCGENGEFHTFVADGPMFQEKVRVIGGDVVMRENRFYTCDLVARGTAQGMEDSSSKCESSPAGSPRREALSQNHGRVDSPCFVARRRASRGEELLSTSERIEGGLPGGQIPSAGGHRRT